MKAYLLRVVTVMAVLVPTLSISTHAAELKEPLDRQAIVARHRIQTDKADITLPVGNGNFCFNVDGTGLQTFKGSVLSHWGWFS